MSLHAGIERPVTAVARQALFTAVQQRTSLWVGEELRRLDGRTQLTAAQRAQVAVALRRLSSRLAISPLAAWKGDPGVAAELFGLPRARTRTSEGDVMPKLTGGSTLAEHKAATRVAMIDAFASQLREVGWQALKLQDVARTVGVARTAVYNYFPDKTALLLAWSEREMSRFMALAERELEDRTDPVDRLQILVKLVLTEFSLQRGAGASVAAMLPPEDRSKFFEHVAPLAAMVGQLLEDGMEQGLFVRADPAVTGQLIMACLETQRPLLLAGEKVHTAVSRTLPFLMRALGVPEDHQPAGS